VRFFALSLSALLLVGCTTPHKTYRPPSSAKVDASTKLVKEGIDRAHEKASRAKRQLEDAQKSDDKIAVLSVTVQQKLDALIKSAPAEMKAGLTDVKTDVTGMQTEQGILRGFLNDAHATHTDLDQHILVVKEHVSKLEGNQRDYYTEAQRLASDATNERESLIRVEQQLIKQKIFGWLWKIGLGAAAILTVILIFLWITGRLAVKLAK
jgi:hypothetical protein